MKTVNLTCVECPMGCQIEVDLEYDKVIAVRGNTCPRGKAYAENEVVCPRRVVTTTVRSANGEMISVKTDKPVKKSEIFDVMKKINAVTAATPVKIGDVIISGVTEDINVISTCNKK